MVKHIVMWKIQGVNGQSKEETAQEIKRTLEDLNGKIEGLIHLEVGIDFLQSDASCCFIFRVSKQRGIRFLSKSSTTC